ncbi:Predicted protein [Taphrina deformans PYCC 5710]|uniref:DUF7962 domain-containing protein n=1 Tax=Taphrina deformans (strain PYCC 5710 / ATCC 11124 / CBS 356.35 / IMI 108563 / JCM 9778 / NBRC 8474) TaxID=1097556 RepID=R4X898_TAPDE|nr:Predicted protein [Taphrina deformans PYCC 5710]|eukprot:CCG81492.1 Predicted protein [Taphrina deformans PYCC 5710]
MVEIIVYGYEMAPNPQKLLQFLSFYNIPFKYVEIPIMLPRPDFTAIDIHYRRAPLLSIDSDMYVDNALIIEKLGDIAAHTGPDVETTNHLEFDALGQVAFKSAVGLVPVDSPMLKDGAFVRDRTELLGVPFSAEKMAEARPQTLSTMLSVLSVIKRTFLDNGDREFFLGGERPSTADMYLYWSVNWGLNGHGGARPEISPETHPEIFAWLSRVAAFLGPRRQDTKISWSEAKAVLLKPPVHEYAKFVPHDEHNVLGLGRGRQITVTPTDSGRTHPQPGELISLNDDQVCLRNKSGLVMHFPRLGYLIQAAE